MSKKSQQLGMNPATASNRLTKDILFHLVVETGKNMCHQCGGEITRDNFSIEHITPWLDSQDPVGLFFDMKNISFSHLKCNISAARKEKSPCGTHNSFNKGCRCEACVKAKAEHRKKYDTSDLRRKRYLRTGN